MLELLGYTILLGDGEWVGRFGFFGCMPFQAGKFPHAELLPRRRTIELTLK